jgi:hypothetical protein
LLVGIVSQEGEPPLAIVNSAHGDELRLWDPPFDVDGVMWLSDSQFLVADAITGDVGNVYVATVSRSDRVTLKKTGLVGTCPAPSPNGSTWAYYDPHTGLVLYDPAAKRVISRWATGAPHNGVFTPPAWADATHVMFTEEYEGGVRMVVLDVSGALAADSVTR